MGWNELDQLKEAKTQEANLYRISLRAELLPLLEDESSHFKKLLTRTVTSRSYYMGKDPSDVAFTEGYRTFARELLKLCDG